MHPSHHSAVIYLLWTLLLHICHASQYVAPGECTWSHVSSQNFEVSLVCSIHRTPFSSEGNHPHHAHHPPPPPPSSSSSSSSSISSTSGLNFSLIQSDYTVSLTLICDYSSEFRIANGSLSHLRFLRSLNIEGCKLPYLSGRSLVGLEQLRNLSIRTYYGPSAEAGSPLSVTAGSLRLRRESLEYLRHIERLDLGFNNMASLPEDLFCPLVSLKVLNLTRNRLSSFGALGVVDESTGHLCLQELQELDMSYNDLQTLHQTGVASLKHINSLYLQHNQLTEVAEIALSALSRLQILDLSSNRLRTLPTRLFHRSAELKELYLQNNSLSSLPVGLFAELSRLLILNLSSNALTTDSLSADTFVDLIRLVILDLSHNRLTRINATIFQAQYSLQILYLNHNNIDWIDDNSFSSVYNLHTLVLSHNRLKTLPTYTLNGLSLFQLELDYNHLTGLEESCFKNCTKLLSVSLVGNRLKHIPEALSDLRSLRTLDLSGNHLRELRNSSSWLSMESGGSLVTLNLSANAISHISLGYFHYVPSLTTLDLSANRIAKLETGIFENATRLAAIHLQGNQLADINGLFMNLEHLRVLNVSCNNMTWFDFALLPRGLLELDIHSNVIELVDNYYKIEDIELRRMDFSHNQLVELGPLAMPNRIEILLLDHNNISRVHPQTFVGKVNLTYVDLRWNHLNRLDKKAFYSSDSIFMAGSGVLDGVTVHLGVSGAAFRIAENPFSCDCEMEWLQRLQYAREDSPAPRILDLEQVKCRLPFVRDGPEVQLTKVRQSEFLCSYKTHCFTLCHCCDFDACDCEMMCPDGCFCYYDSTWNTNIVDCSRSAIRTVPTRVPMDVTELYLDGNELITLTSHTFIGRKNMRSLYLNSSGIVSINNRTFNGLHMLERLHLEHNHLPALNGFEFDGLERLRELYLHHNRIGLVSNRTFAGLPSLEILHLEYNAIVTVDVNSLASRNLRLQRVFLGHNLWSCDCRFVQKMVGWMRDGLVKDVGSVRCYHNLTSLGYLLMQIDSSGCGGGGSGSGSVAASGGTEMIASNTIPRSGIVVDIGSNSIEERRLGLDSAAGMATGSAADPEKMALFPDSLFSANWILWIVSLAVFATLVSLLIVWTKRSALRDLLNSAILRRTRYEPETEKLFDAFVSYSRKDESFISTKLTSELECGPIPYRLCLRYRDLPVSGYIAEAISEAIGSSHRTIVILSEQYLRSDCCLYELKMAYTEAASTKDHALIVILLDKSPGDLLDSDARMILSSVPVIAYDDRRFWEKLKAAMPPRRGKATDFRGSFDFKRGNAV